MSADTILQRFTKAAERISTLESQVEDLKSKLAAAEGTAVSMTHAAKTLLYYLERSDELAEKKRVTAELFEAFLENFDENTLPENQAAYSNFMPKYGNTMYWLNNRVKVLTRLKKQMDSLPVPSFTIVENIASDISEANARLGEFIQRETDNLKSFEEFNQICEAKWDSLKPQ